MRFNDLLRGIFFLLSLQPFSLLTRRCYRQVARQFKSSVFGFFLVLPAIGLLPGALDATELLSTSGSDSRSLSSVPLPEVSRNATTPIVQPTGLRADIYSSSALELFWDRHPAQPDQPGFVSGYRVFRDNRLIGETVGNSFYEDGLVSNAQHQYRVEAITTADNNTPAELELNVSVGGLQSAGSGTITNNNDPVSSTTNVVTGLRVEFYSPTVAEVFWDRAGSAVVSYRVIRDGTSVALTDGTSFFEPVLALGRRFNYRVDAIDASGRTLGSSEISASFSSVPRDTQNGTDITNTPAINGSSIRAVTENQIFELQEGGGPVSIRLTLIRDVDIDQALQLNAVPLDDSNGSVTDVEVSPSVIPAGSSQIDVVLQLSLPVGAKPQLFHERRVQLAAEDGSITDIRYRVLPVRAADIYLLIGQSNMEGFSLNGEREAFAGGLDERNDRVRQLNVTSNNLSLFADDSSFENPNTIVGAPRLIPAEDPLHELRFPFQTAKGGTRIGPGLSFAKAMLGTTTQEIILVPAAWSATGFCSNDILDNIGWNIDNNLSQSFAGTQLYRRALARLELAIAESGGIFRGVIWHQGETDSNNSTCANAYADNLDALIQAIRTNAAVDRRGASARGPNVDIPFVVGTMSRGNDPRGDFADFGFEKQLVDNAHRTVGNRVSFTGVVLTDDLVPPAYPCGEGSCVHFGAAAYREMGARYADVMQQIFSR